jgi:hypothetical protein
VPKTHNFLLPSIIVGLLHDRRVEIIEVEFPLESEFVVGVKEVEGERSFRSVKRRRIPSHP